MIICFYKISNILQNFLNIIIMLKKVKYQLAQTVQNVLSVQNVHQLMIMILQNILIFSLGIYNGLHFNCYINYYYNLILIIILKYIKKTKLKYVT